MKSTFRHLVLALAAIAAVLAFTGCAGPAAMPAVQDAGARADPYVWLEQVDSPQAMDWVRAENAKTLAVLERDPRFEPMQRDALEIVQARDRIPAPDQRDGQVYNFWQDAEHVRGLWRVAAPGDYDQGGTPRWQTVLDLDQASRQASANWVWKGAQCDSAEPWHCLLSLSDGGEDAVTVREFDLHARAFATERAFELPKGKLSVAWQDRDRILASREWKAGELTTSGYPYVVKVLRRGEPLDAAREIFRGAPGDAGGVELRALSDAQDRRAVVIQREVTTFETEQYLVTETGPKLLGLPLKSEIIALYEGQLIARLNDSWRAGDVDVPSGALVALDLAQASARPESLQPTVVYRPGPRESLTGAAATSRALVVTTLDNVRGRAALYRRAGDGAWSSARVPLPDNAAVDIADTDPRSAVAYFSVTSFLQPSSLWRDDTATVAATRIRALPPKFDAANDEVEQFEATSPDNTRVPYFIVHPKGLALDGSHPTILYAYGGFAQPITPFYSGVVGKLWLERGGIYVVANIRGGGEFGPAWHDAGLKTRRQVIYDDFAAVGRDLVARGFTSPRRLGIEGGSNGGLLMGVEMTQHPDMWHAVDIQVPLLDMERYEQIAAGSSWTGEYGSMSVPEERAFLEHISPYRNLRRGTEYPQALVWTTTKDDRVGPQHARKFAARLSEYGIPYYYYEVIEGGHAAGANLKERAHTSALEFTYFARQLMDR